MDVPYPRHDDPMIMIEDMYDHVPLVLRKRLDTFKWMNEGGIPLGPIINKEIEDNWVRFRGGC